MTTIGVILSVFAILMFLPVVALSIEILFALAAGRSGRVELPRSAGLRVAVLVPAYNEEDGIGLTVSRIAKQLSPADRLIVVADNCSDTTAEIARAAGAETLVRHDPGRRGKGYALDFGIRHLSGNPPDIVLIVDADCRFGCEAIDRLVACVERSGRPAQALNVVILPSNTNSSRRLASFAWIVKNHVRPEGLAVLGFPCQLMGTGMAIPWEAMKCINLATGNIVEDVKMGLDLAAARFAPIYCPGARVESDFPLTERGFAVQRQRWETGSLHVVLKIAPVMFLRALLTFNLPLMVMAADLMVPPIMMFLSVMMLGLVLSLILVTAGGSVFPAEMFVLSLFTLLLVLLLAWVRFGRDVLLPRDVLSLPIIFIRKYGLYFGMWRQRGAGWIRTDRK